VRRAIIEEAEPAASGRLITALNRAMEATRREMLQMLQQQQQEEGEGGSSSDEEGEGDGGELDRLKSELAQLRDQLAAEREERGREAARRLPDADMVEARLAEMAALLQVQYRVEHSKTDLR
jgi:hypothetical protein